MREYDSDSACGSEYDWEMVYDSESDLASVKEYVTETGCDLGYETQYDFPNAKEYETA